MGNFNCLKGFIQQGPIAQSVMADLGVVSSIPAHSHTFVEIDHEIIFGSLIQERLLSVIQAKICTRSTG